MLTFIFSLTFLLTVQFSVTCFELCDSELMESVLCEIIGMNSLSFKELRLTTELAVYVVEDLSNLNGKSTPTKRQRK